MRFDKFFETMGPMVAMAFANGGFKTADGKFNFEGREGVPLDELDLSGEVPTVIKLLGADVVRITEGADFTIAVEGEEEAKARMRFLAEDGSLMVLRDREGWRGGPSSTVTITMPAPEQIELLGSGAIHCDALAQEAKIAILGSGKVETHGIETRSLKVKFAGSGSYKASGTTGELKLSIAGSGNAKLGSLKADKVQIAITGSGDATFACDGEVDAKITGSGKVTVRGSARCRVKSFGSGVLICEPAGSVTLDHEEIGQGK
ncbi:MAG TPA: head GIN domain-containing protein [Sphingomonadaceae bacterium]|nr:head GIN domain-containing protein [Sphingomonadaceae bacterium]